MTETWTHEDFQNLKLWNFPGFTKVEVVEVQQDCVVVDVERIRDAKQDTEIDVSTFGDSYKRIIRG